MSAIEKLLAGSIDMHVHHGPDAHRERRVDALQAVLQAQRAGMRAIVLKSHDYPTAPLAYILSQTVPNISIVGSIALDLQIGGLNTHALEVSAKLGAKVVWMPTMTSAHDMARQGRAADGIRIVDNSGKLLPVISSLLEIVKSNQMVLCTGHVSPAEAFALVDEARKQGIWKVVATHPLLEKVGATLTIEEQLRMADKGVFIEHCFADTMPMSGLDPRKIFDAIRAVGAERCILSTDFGQDWNPAPAEGMRMAIAVMLRCGLTEKEVETIVKINPARLLGLD